MSESQVQYFKLLEKKYSIEEDIYKKLGDMQDLKKKIADQNKKRAKDEREREESLISKAEYEVEGLIDKALKSEVKAKKKEASIAEKDYKIRELERRIVKVEDELSKLESELQEAENDINAHKTGEPAYKEPVYQEDQPPLEPTVFEDIDE